MNVTRLRLLYVLFDGAQNEGRRVAEDERPARSFVDRAGDARRNLQPG